MLLLIEKSQKITCDFEGLAACSMKLSRLGLYFSYDVKSWSINVAVHPNQAVIKIIKKLIFKYPYYDKNSFNFNDRSREW
jgi:hypothetical protein